MNVYLHGVTRWGEGQHLCYPHTLFKDLLTVAQHHGWRPYDDELSDNLLFAEFNTTYAGNEYQRVTAQDAVRIATALEHALQSAALRADMRDYVRQLKHFCESGGFEIGL